MTLVRATQILLFTLGTAFAGLAADLAQEAVWRGPIPLGDATPRPADAGRAAAAFGDGVHLVALVRHWSLAFVRLDADGNLLDPLPVLIEGPGLQIQDAAVAWDGTRFLVVWRHYFFEVRGRFVRPDGTFEGDAFLISDATFGRGPAVVSNGETFLVTGGGHHNLSIVSGSGSVTPVDASAVPYERSDVAGLVTDGEGYLVLLELFHGVGVFEAPLLLRVKDDGTSTTLPFRPALRKVGLARIGEGLILTGVDSALTAFELSLEGEVIAGPHVVHADPGPNVRLTVTEDGSGGVLIAGAAESTLLRWQPGDETATVIATPAPSTMPVTSHSGRPLLLLRSGGVLQHTFLEPDDSIESPRPTLRTAPDQTYASVAPTETGWFAVWSERRGERMHVRGAVLASGSLAQLREFEIAEGINTGGVLGVAAGPDGTLVIWGDHDQGPRILGRRYTHRGEPLDEAPFVVTPDGYAGSYGEVPVTIPVLWNGRYFLAAFWRASTGTLSVTRITAEGTVLDPVGIPLPPPEREPGHQHNVSLAVAGETTVVTWEDGIPFQECRTLCIPMPPSRVESVALDIEGQPMSASPLVLSEEPESDRFGVGYAPVIAAAGGRFLVVWRTYDEVVARVLDGDGVPIGQRFTLDDSDFSARDSVRISVAGMEERFVVVWESPLGSDRRRLSGRIVGNRGVLLDRLEIPLEIVVAAGTYPNPSIHSDDGTLLLLFSRWSEEQGGVRRIYMLTTDEKPPRRRGVRPGA